MKRNIALLLASVMLLTSCQPSTVISNLEKVVAAAEFALPVIATVAGLPAEVSAAIVTYLQAVDAAIVQASAILAEPGNTASKSARIIQAFAGIAKGCGCIPPGTPALVVNVVDAVAQAVAHFIEQFTAKSLLPTPTPNVKVTGRDRAALSDIRSRAEQNAAKLKTLKH